MFQRGATEQRFKLGSAFCCAAVLIACGTTTGPIASNAEPQGTAGAPAEDTLDSTDASAGGNASATQSTSSEATTSGGSDATGSGGGGSGGVDSTEASVSTVSGSVNGGTENNCGEEPCDDEGGDTCTDPIAVGKHYVLDGDDFTAKFAGDVELTDHNGCRFSDTGASDAVLSVKLKADDQLVVTQKGELAAVFALLDSCERNSCVKSEYGGRGTALTYTALKDETLLLVVDALLVEPTTSSYEIWVDINPECGNGSLEGQEECDDENLLEDDGCSPSCVVEFPWSCDGASPSECELPPSLGSVHAGEPIDPIEYDDSFDVDDRLYYTVTFEERVLVDLSATTRTPETGDVDIFFYDDWNSEVKKSNLAGDDVRTDIPFEPGTYLVVVTAKTDLPEGFDVVLTAHSAGVCGDGEVISLFEDCDNGGHAGCEDCTVAFEYTCDSGSPSTCVPVEDWDHAFGEPFTVTVDPGTFIYWMLDVSEDAVLSGNITSDENPSDEYAAFAMLWSETGKIPNDDNDEVDYYGGLPTWSVAAGRYKLEFWVYTGFPSGYTLTLTLTTP